MIPPSVCRPWPPDHAANAAQLHRSYTTRWDTTWHILTRNEDYAGVRPALHAKKLRDLELRSGQPMRRGQRGSAYEYNLSWTLLEERHRAEQNEVVYRRLTEGWSKQGRRVPTDAAGEERR